ncbi:hypothetical protein DSO57_1005242 [Entomophthora muscae]|uniref:Uncharacterized protein n=1 Tax=Entomophthora muscae TaxID=34485 RepID=A0ACC2U6C8_9FUNG|nr:hypothetical protein DSO57_1005242 [Entomophthora muscae]
MHLSSLAQWPYKESFTDMFLNLSFKLGRVKNFGYNPAQGRFSKQFYYWTGSEVITDPITCYKFEFFTIQLSWNQSYWEPISKVTKAPGTSFKKEQASRRAFNFNSKTKAITYSFYGPGEHTIVFNRIQLVSQRVIPKKAVYTRKNYGKKRDLTFKGVLAGVKKEPLAAPI